MSKKKKDLVYLWVDGSDSLWKKKNRAALVALGRELPTDSTALNKFRENNELKYSLRSLEKFAPWINHIFIVTDGQRPAWLSDDPRITIVDHTEIIPKKYLPVFNSSAIELFLHKIPGLSEHFLFANDDMVFGAPVTPDFFFDKHGNPIVIVKARMTPAPVFADDARYAKYADSRNVLKSMVRNGIRFTYKKTGKKYHAYLAHAIEPMQKSFLKSLFAKYGDELISATATQFREVSNVQRIVYPLMANAMGQNTIVRSWRAGGRRVPIKPGGNALSIIFCTTMRRVLHKLGLVKYDLYDEERNVTRDIRKFKPKMFCINDISEAKNAFLENVELLNEMFPDKSRFEK